MQLEFRPIRLPDDEPIARQFRMDRFSNFDPETMFRKTWPNVGDYEAWLAEKQAWDPAATAHVWHNNQIIGQIECGYRNTHEENAGYVNFYYLAPAFRNNGLGAQLVTHTDTLFRNHGLAAAWLSTTEDNAAGLRFYAKNGYKVIGSRAGHPGMLLLRKSLISGLTI